MRRIAEGPFHCPVSDSSVVPCGTVARVPLAVVIRVIMIPLISILMVVPLIAISRRPGVVFSNPSIEVHAAPINGFVTSRVEVFRDAMRRAERGPSAAV